MQNDANVIISSPAKKYIAVSYLKVTIGKLIIWDLEKRPMIRGLLYCVPISEGPLSEVLLYRLDNALRFLRELINFRR